MSNPNEARNRRAAVAIGLLAVAAVATWMLMRGTSSAEAGATASSAEAGATGWAEYVAAAGGSTVTSQTIESSSSGWYMLRLDHPSPGGPEQVPVYWMAPGTAAQAPAAIKELEPYRTVVDNGTAAATGVTFYEHKLTVVADEDNASGTDTLGVEPLRVPGHCANTYFCLYEHNNYDGDYVLICCVNTWRHLSDSNMNVKVSSQINDRNKVSKLSQHIDGNDNPGGTIKCYKAFGQNPDFSDGFNDEASGARRALADNC